MGGTLVQDEGVRSAGEARGFHPRERTADSITALVVGHARSAPDRIALLVPGERDQAITYAALADRVAAYSEAIGQLALTERARVMLLARPDIELYAFALAVIGSGHAIVLVDGRQARRRVMTALAAARPDVVVAAPALLRWWPFVGALRRARRISTGRRVAGTLALSEMAVDGARAGNHAARPVAGDAPAIISFTSGSTGQPKAIVRTNEVLLAQHAALAREFADDGGANLVGFPAATLHALCCGATSIIPPDDVRAMADADPASVVALVERLGITTLSGSPAFVRRLAVHVLARGAPMPGVTRLIVGGAPVGRALCRQVATAFPNATMHVVYGATEAEPIATVTGAEILAAGDEGGFLVGAPTTSELALAPRSTGEVVVRGPHVIGAGWHRTGDVAHRDDAGRLWLLGRVGEQIGHYRPVWPYVAEASALGITGVVAAALVAHRAAPEGELLLVADADQPTEALLTAVRDALAEHALFHVPVRIVRDLPMDARHGSKVLRDALRRQLERGKR